MPEEILQRPKFLDELLAEVDTFDATLFPPTYKVEEGDSVKGIVTDPWTRKCYSLMRHYYRQMKFIAVDRDFHSDEEIRSDAEIAGLQLKYDVLREMIWAIVRAEFQLLFDAESVGLRENWQIVVSKTEDDADPFRAMILGMMRGRKPKL